ncbi:RRP12-like protein [Xenia sp. Carnegie-2017]|uniref:RRP12-like protein n=1 Tax=Xenia sp. Carnegie-2017 TaxID=2897299 RepID=UPI001F04CC4D|nr:RRP12-like protein [Xenia sp. Carnegie-2017]
MVKIRKAKGKIWAKRQSCSSNPSISSHRDAAKRGFREEGQARSNLTVEAIARHNEHDDDEDVILDEVETTGKSDGNFSISGLTDCSNSTFSIVLKRFWQSPGANHREICAVLAAVTEVIRKNNGKETETEYFAALMTALEKTDDESSLSAISFLLSLVIKRVPRSILQVKFSAVCQAVLTILSAKVDSASTALLKNLLACLSTALKAQEATVWSNSSTLKSFQGLLSFTVHSKPKVRKCAQESVASIINYNDENAEFHPACLTASKFCIQELEQYKGSSQAISALHILGLLKSTISNFSSQTVKMICESLLKLMTMGNIMLSMNCMQVLYRLFQDKPSTSTLNVKLNGQLINALFDYQPNAVDEQQAVAWLTLMEKAYSNFQRLDPSSCADSCVKLFASCMTFLLSHHSVVKNTAGTTMKFLLQECISPMSQQLCLGLESKDTSVSPVLAILKCLESGIKLRYQGSWRIIIDVISKFFELFGKLCPERLTKCLVSLCNLHNSPGIQCRRELEKTVGMAFRVMGPKFVLQVVPLDLDKDANICEFPRSWLLPVMRDHIQETEMIFFFKTFLPLADSLREKAEKLKANKSDLEAKVFTTLSLQIWDTLPSFCTKPTDLLQSFKSVAKTLGSLLNERDDLRGRICQAIRLLVSRNLDNEEYVKELSRYAKNYLPILFNLYTACEEKNDSVSLPILGTLKTYLQITDKKLVEQFFKKAFDRVKSTDTPSAKKHMLMDLIIAMVQYLNDEDLEVLYGTIEQWLKAKDSKLQKKSYRILEEICCAGSAEEYFLSHVEDIQKVMEESLNVASSVSKAPRLRCLIQIVKKVQPGQEMFLNTIIPEVILSTREVNSKARSASLKLLVQIAETYIRCSQQSTEACIDTFLGTLVAGFGGSPNMVSGTIIAMSKILYEYKGRYTAKVLNQLIETTTNLLQSNKREIVKSALGFFMVALRVTSSEEFSPYLKNLVSGLVNWSDESRNKFRFKAQVLFERLIRKYGYKVIYDLVPEEHRKFVRNIHKRVERGKRKKVEGHSHSELYKLKEKSGHIDSYEDLMFGSDDDEDDAENDKSSLHKNKNLKKKSIPKAFIQESEPDEPLDLLSSNISQHITATAPLTRRSKDSGFELTEDGRLIIPDENETNTKKSEIPSGSSILREDMELEPSSVLADKRKRVVSDDGTEEAVVGKKSKFNEDFGEEYRAKKAGGDMKKKGKPDPYAYLPLNTNVLNKRKRAKLTGQFKGIVKGVKRGSQKSKKFQKRK